MASIVSFTRTDTWEFDVMYEDDGEVSFENYAYLVMEFAITCQDDGEARF